MMRPASVIMIALTSVLLAQETNPGPQPGKPSELPAEIRSRDYRLGTGDLLAITVFGVADLDRVVRVSSTGSITLPQLGKIEAAGTTAQQLEARIAEMLADEKLVLDPQVTVFIKEYRSQPVYALGAVNQPGQYMVTHQLRLIDALSMAGGVDVKKAGDHLFLQRRIGTSDPDGVSGGGEGPRQVTRIDLKALLEKGDASLNVTLEAGDVIQVPERKAEVFYVVGDVGRPGGFEFPSEDKTLFLVSRALSWAGGPSKTAKMSKGILMRYDDKGRRQELAVDFKAILSGRKPDLPVRPNDIIFIPGSTSKTVAYGLLGSIPGGVQAVIWRAPL